MTTNVFVMLDTLERTVKQVTLRCDVFYYLLLCLV